MPIRIGTAISVEVFDPPLFAALCSPDLNTALRRIARFKRLIGPTTLAVEAGSAATTVEIRFPDALEQPPLSLIGVELVFFVELARLATRSEIWPLRVTSRHPLPAPRVYTGYFGVPIDPGEAHAVSFSAADARRAFLTGDHRMWDFFEPGLRARLAGLEAEASTEARARSVLLELLPSGRSTIRDVARALGLRTRTLQRRFRDEATSFQRCLARTREQLARHYLARSDMPGSQIAFLLGFEDPNSFFRAFRAWTGQTPERARSSLRRPARADPAGQPPPPVSMPGRPEA